MTDLMQKAVEAFKETHHTETMRYKDANPSAKLQEALDAGTYKALEAALRVLSAEAVAWMVESERAGFVSVERLEAAADTAILNVVREYGDAYGVTTKRPLFLAPRPATKAEEADIDAAAGLTKITLRFPDEQMNKIGNYAAQRGIVVGAAIRELVGTGLNNALASPS